jgi:hypothetical protein
MVDPISKILKDKEVSGIIKKIDDKFIDYSANKTYEFLKKNIEESKNKEPNKLLNNKYLMGSLYGTAALAGGALARLIKIKSEPLFKKKYLIPLAISGAVSGYFAPDTFKKLQEINNDKEAIKLLKDKYKGINKVYFKTNKLLVPISQISQLAKMSSWYGSALKGVGTALTSGTRKAWGVTPIRRAAKIGIGSGALYGGYKGVKHIINKNKNMSGNNYTTMLRNNILSGNIDQEQLSQPDLIDVKRIGMK